MCTLHCVDGNQKQLSLGGMAAKANTDRLHAWNILVGFTLDVGCMVLGQPMTSSYKALWD